MNNNNIFKILEQKGRPIVHPLCSTYGKCFELVEGMESTLYFFPESGVMLKKGNEIYKDKVLREAYWIKQLPAGLRTKFPEILSICDVEYCYAMKAYPYAPISKMISTSNISALMAFTYWHDAYSYFLSYRKSFRINPPKEWENCLLDKIKFRLQIIKNKSTYFASLLTSPTILIDNIVYLNVESAINTIEQLIKLDINCVLRPEYLTLMHLDLQFSNILADDSYILVDPLGDEAGDPLYDVMKAVHHIDNEYINKNYITASSVNNNLSNNVFTISLCGGTEHKDRDDNHINLLNIFEKFILCDALDHYADIFTHYWGLRFWYEYATTMIGGTLFVLLSNDTYALDKAITRYCFGTYYLNMFIRYYTNHLINININVPENLTKNVPYFDCDKTVQDISSQIISFIKLKSKYAHK